MTSEEANIELEQLRGIADNGGDLAPHKQRIEALYLAVLGIHLRKCKCKNVLKDALIEIYSRLRRNGTTKKSNNMAQARLVKGVVVFFDGNHYTNANLTDDVARAFLEKFPMRKDWFEILPSATTGKEVVAEVAEIASNEKKAEGQPTTPKKKKTARKRK